MNAGILLGFMFLVYMNWKQAKDFNRSILILEQRINNQQHQINKLNIDITDLKRRY